MPKWENDFHLDSSSPSILFGRNSREESIAFGTAFGPSKSARMSTKSHFTSSQKAMQELRWWQKITEIGLFFVQLEKCPLAPLLERSFVFRESLKYSPLMAWKKASPTLCLTRGKIAFWCRKGPKSGNGQRTWTANDVIEILYVVLLHVFSRVLFLLPLCPFIFVFIVYTLNWLHFWHWLKKKAASAQEKARFP